MEGELIEKDGKVVLPFDKEQFTKFISSLLGRPQTVEQRFAFPFEISTNDVKDTFYLVEQRVHDQNSANLIQFSVNVSYNDGSSIIHESLEDFLSYKEVKALVPSSIILTWTYLITFQNRDTPEKQEIELSFISHASHFSPEYSYTKFDHWFRNSLGMSKLKIKHCSRSWASDIEALLTNHIRTFEKQESNFRKKCRKHSSRISVFCFLFIFFLGLVGLLTTTYLLTENEKVAVENILSPEVSASLEEKVSFLINHSLLGHWPRYFFSSFLFVCILIVGGIFISSVIEEASEHKEPSFILISKNSKKHKEDVIKKLDKTWKNYVASLIGGIFSGILANIIFASIWVP